MKPDFKKLFGQIKNTKVLFIIFIVGIVLLMIPGGSDNKEEKTLKENTDDFIMYQDNLQKDLEKIISNIKGVGNVDVMVTFYDSGNTYFAKDESESTTKSESETAKSKDITHVLKSDEQSTEAPLITKKTYPAISGVLICAKGAQNPQIKNNIIKAAQALLGVKSHRIEVLERK